MKRWITDAEAMVLAAARGFTEEQIAANGLGDVLYCDDVDFDQGLYLVEETDVGIEKVGRYRRRTGELVRASRVANLLTNARAQCLEASADDELQTTRELLLGDWPSGWPRATDIVQISEEDFAPSLTAGKIYVVFEPGTKSRLCDQAAQLQLVAMLESVEWMQWESSGEPTLYEVAKALEVYKERIALVVPTSRGDRDLTLMIDHTVYGTQEDTLLIKAKEIPFV